MLNENYSTKTDLKNATSVDTSKFIKTVDLANLKSNVDKLDIDKLKNVVSNLTNLKSKLNILDVDKLVPVPFDLGKLNDAAVAYPALSQGSGGAKFSKDGIGTK